MIQAAALAQSTADAGQSEPDASDSLPSPETALPWRSMVDDPLGLEPSDEDLGKSLLKEMDAEAGGNAEIGDALLFGPPPPPFRAKEGEVVTAVAAIRESEHHTRIDIAHGLANVSVTMRFTSVSEKPAEIRYRLAAPLDSGIESLKVCNANGCRTGFVDRPRELSLYDDALLARGPRPTLPIARAAFQKDARGDAIVIRAAPIFKGSDLTVSLTYVTPVKQHNGITRLHLPARGMDPRAAPTALEVSPSLRDSLVTQSPLVRDAWLPNEVVVRAPFSSKPLQEAWRFSCDKKRCARARVAAPPSPLEPVDLTLFVDASPSMIGPARGRVAAAISVLMASAPRGTRVRALAFAARSKPIVERYVDALQLPLTSLADSVVGSDLGSATRFESAWQRAKTWFQAEKQSKNRSIILIVGDGGLTTSESGSRAFVEAKRAGIEVSVLNLADRDVVAALREGVQSTRGAVVNAGIEAEQASRGYGAAALEDRIAAFFVKVAVKEVAVRLGKITVDLGSLRAGEEVVWEGVLETKGFRLLAGKKRPRVEEAPGRIANALEARIARAMGIRSPREVLVAVDPDDLRPSQSPRPVLERKNGTCDPRGPAWRKSGVSSDEAPVALAEQPFCFKPETEAAAKKKSYKSGTGMPSEPLLAMLRGRIIPIARGCFRRDRAGRPNYSKRAVFLFQLAEREVVSAQIEGKITERLRDCLLSAVDGLDVPSFSGNVIVRYPLYTETEPLPYQIELTAEVAKQVDSLLSRSRDRSP
ncbi:MAG: VWA domain-containing protein [Deltaproteobacteria bacterium]|nr:VWA domain-containing protein [Deltaproteobacteria bacterium]